MHIRDGAHDLAGVGMPRWDDLRIIPGANLLGGVNDPVSGSWQIGGAGTAFTVYKFNDGDELFFTTQMPHGYILCTDLLVHVHWTPGERGTEEGTATVGWKVECAIAPFDGVFPAATTLDLTDACKSTDDEHLKTVRQRIDGSAFADVSSMIVGRIYRDGGTWVGTNADAPILLELDFHYQKDELGSLLEIAKR